MDAKIATIEALLRKAESTSNAHEAEAFAAKAEALMIKHGIEQAELFANAGRTEPIVRESIVFTGAYSHVNQHGAYYVADAFSEAITCYVTTRSASHRTLWIVGFESEVAAVKVLLASLQMQSTTALNAWWATGPSWRRWERSEGHEKFMARRSFVQGFWGGAAARLREARESAVAATVGTGTDLVLASRADKVQAWVDENIGLSGRTSRGLVGGVGRGAGREAGRRADVGTTRVGGAGRALGR
jgi:hypothetical protein